MEYNPTSEQLEAQKRAIYEKMSPRRRKFVDRIGYESWDPFAKPFDPIDIRRDITGHTAHELTNMFLESLGRKPEQDYVDTVSEFNVTLVTIPDRVRPLFEFCQWYANLLQERGLKL
ncbi:MAG: hypothetical protein V3573_05440 [Desulfovibrionaceae bacterium]